MRTAGGRHQHHRLSRQGRGGPASGRRGRPHPPGGLRHLRPPGDEAERNPDLALKTYMSETIIEKILSRPAGRPVRPGDIVDISIDARIARDFGGASVVKNLREHRLPVEDVSKTFFTFDCNPGGSDQKYAANQHLCRLFARERAINLFDIDAGIGTHIAIDEGLVVPGGTLVSTDSHANILGAIGAFGQGMGDQDIAAAWAFGRGWFKVPESGRIELKGDLQSE